MTGLLNPLSDSMPMFPLPNLDSKETPEWFLDLRKKAFEKMNSLCLPTKDDESWRKFALKSIPVENFGKPSKSTLDVSEKAEKSASWSSVGIENLEKERADIESAIQSLFVKGN